VQPGLRLQICFVQKSNEPPGCNISPTYTSKTKRSLVSFARGIATVRQSDSNVLMCHASYNARKSSMSGWARTGEHAAAHFLLDTEWSVRIKSIESSVMIELPLRAMKTAKFAINKSAST
jgi:hypothetical protein